MYAYIALEYSTEYSSSILNAIILLIGGQSWLHTTSTQLALLMISSRVMRVSNEKLHAMTRLICYTYHRWTWKNIVLATCPAWQSIHFEFYYFFLFKIYYPSAAVIRPYQGYFYYSAINHFWYITYGPPLFSSDENKNLYSEARGNILQLNSKHYTENTVCTHHVLGHPMNMFIYCWNIMYVQ